MNSAPSMDSVPSSLESKTLEHLGLVSGMVDELGLVEHIDRLIPQDPTDRHVSVGQAVKAVTMGQIADILQARGQLDEALRIYQSEVLPVFEQLGDVRSLLAGRTNLALLLWQMDATANAARVQELLCLALSEARRLQLPEAVQVEGILEERGLSCDGNTGLS